MENRTAGITGASHRHLVLGLDGTWNTPDQQDRDRECPSNVVKLLRAVDTRQEDIEQILSLIHI